MEHFFSPTRRLQDIWEEHNDVDPFNYTEVALAVPVEEFLSYRWAWEDLCAFASGDMIDKVLWITDNNLLVIGDASDITFDYDNPYYSLLHASSMATSGKEQTLTYLKEIYADVSTEACNVFWRAIETSSSVTLTIQTPLPSLVGLPSNTVLSQFLRGNPGLQVLELYGFHFKEAHCRALTTLERTDLKVKLHQCTFRPKDSEDSFIEWFRHNQVVTELDRCLMESSLHCAFGGNNSVKKLTINYSEKQTCSLLRALPGNMGIEHLSVWGGFSEATWCLLLRSLATHPRIMFLSAPFRTWISGSVQPLSADVKTTRMNAILQMLRLNTVVQTIELPDSFSDESVYQNSILPRLEMNRTFFEVQRRAVKRADPAIRPQLLGRALHVVRYNPNLVFIFLSENVPAFVRREEEEVGDSTIPLQNDPAIVSVAGQKRTASS